ncbi:MipA/OmpV family protein [Oceanospirillum linum]|uniref:Uncharacterized protein n=1 Tax=Oceanospirillum linum TaxID=966 RepID=A0A1T1HCM7_OCELI|nr:MipA/OmpV family protein [Oceanospirillum linum]OOV87624.1 hypothetical protein BTA35_0206220 [Oceanospirillum linum]SEF94153.1 Outer membrane scaffolding protein for murein synthesis, MipA/OmpV family [Oleiphilus messinensis]SMP11957.1 Outer membrane scaffolding protein for murein synthesis, MipA/OmpV family [Oceanospirillum linum]
MTQNTALPFINAEVGNWHIGPKYGIAQYIIRFPDAQYGLGVGYRDDSYHTNWIPGFKASRAPELDGYESGGGDVTFLAQFRYRQLTLKMEQDISGNSDGFTAEVAVEHILFGRGLGLNLKANTGFYWQSQDYVRHLYGVSGRNVDTNKGRFFYEPDSALNLFASVNVSYIFDQRWGVHSSYRFEYFDTTITDSPIVDGKNKQALHVTLTYRM